MWQCGAMRLGPRRTRRRSWGVAVAGVIVALTATILFVLRLSPQSLSIADQSASVISGVVGVAGLLIAAAALVVALRDDGPRPSVASDPARAAAPTAGVWNIEPPVHTFAGRGSQLDELDPGTRRIALYGMPGVGKTQLAKGWAHRHADRWTVGWWVRGEDPVALVTDLAALAVALGVGVEGGDDLEAAARRAVNELAGRNDWLLIIDDAVGGQSIAGWLPAQGGCVLVTSRNPDWLSFGPAVEVPVLATGQAADFLNVRTGDPDRSAAAEIARMLDGLPLALEQAGAYCRQSNRGLASFAALLRQGDKSRLLDGAAPTGYRKGPVTTTVRLAARGVAQRDPAAGQLLSLLAYLAPTTIPRDLPAVAPHLLPRPLRRVVADSVRLDRAIGVLIESALVAPDGPGYLRIHQLVQDILREPPARGPDRRRLPSMFRPRSQRWSTIATKLLMTAFAAEPGDRAGRRRLIELAPHMQALIDHADSRDTDSGRLLTSITELADKLRRTGDLDVARQLVEGLVDVRRRTLGPEHPETLASLTDLAAALSASGEFEAAVRLLEEILSVRRRTLGESDPLTLATLDDLAATLRTAGRTDAARQVAERVVEVRRRDLGDDHPETRGSLESLTDVLGEIDASKQPFINLARRAGYLVERALKGLEDPEANKLSTTNLLLRIRRYADAGLILGGHPVPDRLGNGGPVRLVDVLREASASCEAPSRTEMRMVDPDLRVSAEAAGDLICLLAELLDNSLAFSPPQTRVAVDARRLGFHQAVVMIEDKGLGMSSESLAEWNAFLAQPQPLHQLLERVGLNVVARAAFRQGIRVEFSDTPVGGVRAAITLPLSPSANEPDKFVGRASFPLTRNNS